MLDNARSSELAALLAWYRDMGVDHAVGESPVDWLSRGDRAPGHSFTLATPGEVAAPAPAVPPPRVAPPRPASGSIISRRARLRRLRPLPASFPPPPPMRP